MTKWDEVDDRMRDEVDPCACGGKLDFVGPAGWDLGEGDRGGWAYRCRICGELWIYEDAS